MSMIERSLRMEEAKHREGNPSPKRDVADLLAKGAEEIARLNCVRDELVAYLNTISRQTAETVMVYGGTRRP